MPIRVTHHNYDKVYVDVDAFGLPVCALKIPEESTSTPSDKKKAAEEPTMPIYGPAIAERIPGEMCRGDRMAIPARKASGCMA